jgi:hypothetical protein
MRGLIWPLKTILIAALAAAGLLMASGFKTPDEQNVSFTIETTRGHENEDEGQFGGEGDFFGAGY